MHVSVKKVTHINPLHISGRLHFLGLVSDGSVHSHIDHLKRFLFIAKQEQIPQCFVHFFADGRGKQNVFVRVVVVVVVVVLFV